jgi:hypothetical protein
MIIRLRSRQPVTRPAAAPTAGAGRSRRPGLATAPTAGAGRSRRPGLATAATAAGWYAIGILGLFRTTDLPLAGQRDAVFVLSGAALLFGVWVWWRHGATAITAVGIHHFAFALFVGFAGLHLLFTGTADESLVRALAWCYFGQVTTWLLFWSHDRKPAPREPEPVNRALLRRMTWVGAAVAAVATLASLHLLGTPRHFAQAAGFVGALLLVLGLLGDERRSPLPGCVAAAAAFAAAIATSNSYGRLMLGSLGLALLVVISRRVRTRLLKAAVVACAAPILLAFAQMRKDAILDKYPDIRMDGTGLESVASPLKTFALLLDYNDIGAFANAWGHTFLAALTSLVPRALWPGKPPGFGADLVPIVNPELVNSGHSDAALLHGEWLYNFGVAGLLLMVPITGLAVRAADDLLAKATARPLVDRRTVFVLGAAIIVAAGLPDLAWGTFTFAARAGMRLMVLIGVLLLLTDRRTTWPGPPTPSGRPARSSRTPGITRPTAAGSSAPSPEPSGSRSAAGSVSAP